MVGIAFENPFKKYKVPLFPVGLLIVNMAISSVLALHEKPISQPNQNSAHIEHAPFAEKLTEVLGKVALEYPRHTDHITIQAAHDVDVQALSESPRVVADTPQR